MSYMKRTGTDRPELAARASEHIDAGYQRLLGFEVREEPGGFDWWGKAPANLFLTAYALMEFRDLAEVHPVDAALLPRIVAWLRSKQADDGSWNPDGIKTGWSNDMAKGKSFPLTAYIAWGLARAGQPSEKATAFVRAHAAEIDDPYALSLAALALLTSDPRSTDGHALARRLAAARSHDDKGVLFLPAGETAIGARGESAAIETTALATQALLADGGAPSLAADALDRLVAWRGADGRFGTTQSTILSLMALLAADPGGGARSDVEVTVGRTERAGRTVRLPADSTEPAHLDLDAATREARGPLVLRQSGAGRTRVSFARTTWVPWDAAGATTGPRASRLSLDVSWPADVLPVGRPAHARVVVSNRSRDAKASVVTLEIGVPPGCDVEREDVVGEGAEAVERAERAVVIYLRDLAPGQTREFRVAFRPRYALDVMTAPSTAYEYYVPEEAVVVAPQRVRAAR